jgi:hypothetical protein
MRFAYADPPYPGQSADLYANHPDYAGEVDSAELIARLARDYPDGWALSTSARALPMVLSLCPAGVWVAAWHKSNSPPIRTTRRYIWSWEPVLIYGGRHTAPPVRDALSCGQNQGFPGQKSPIFTRWIVNLLGATVDDTIDDLFPGSCAVTEELAAISKQPVLLWEQQTLDGESIGRSRKYIGGNGANGRRRRGI